MTEIQKEDIEHLFKELKSKIEHNTRDSLDVYYNNALVLGAKYKASNQIASLKKLVYLIGTIEKEKELLSLGITQYLYRDDIQFYLNQSAAKRTPVCLQELTNYEREIPDDIVKKIASCKHLFGNSIYVIFTDYTGKVSEKAEAVKRATDPIVFGTFEDRENNVASDKCYVIGDWEDEYCDLTLSKLIAQNRQYGRECDYSIYDELSIDKLKSFLAANDVSQPSRIIMQGKRTLWEHLCDWWQGK